MRIRHFYSLFLAFLIFISLMAVPMVADAVWETDFNNSAEQVTLNNPDDSVTTADLSDGMNTLVWWIVLAVSFCGAIAAFIFRKKVLSSLSRVISVILIIILALGLILPGYALISQQSPFSFLGSGRVHTVSFDTDGGSEISSVEVPHGGKLDEIQSPFKTGHAFTGWYHDTGFKKPFYSDEQINHNMTLYASYEKTDANAKIYEDRDKYLEDCKNNFAVTIVSPFTITAQNIHDYIQVTTYLGDLPEFDVRYSDGSYYITPLTPFTDGGHYRFSLIDDSISFHGESPSVRTLDFRIYKEPVEVVELRDDIKYIYWNDAIILDSGAYYVPVSSAVSKGEIICFWDGEINDNSRFFNVLLASPPSDIDGRPMVLLTVEESKVTEILEDLNVHFSDKMLMSDQLVGIDTDEIAEEARNSQGTRQLTSLLACAISQSTTFNDLLSLSGITSAYVSESMADGEQFLPIEENDEDKIEFPLEIMSQVINQALEQDLTVSAYVTTSQNSNFFNAGPDDWTTMSLTFTYNTIIKNKISIRATFTVTESIKSTAQGDAWVDDDEYTIEDFFSENIIPDMYFDFAINNYSQTDFDLSVLIKTVDTTDSDYIDITKELEEMTKPGSESDAASFLEEILGSKGDYITLLDIPLITLVYPIIQECPVLQLNVDLNFVVKVNFAAGISSHATVMSAKQAGISGDTITGVDTYQNTLIGNNRYTFDFYCAGYLGFKAGIKLSFSLSVYGLPGLGKVGFSGEVGAYLDIYGFMHLNISKLQQYSDQKDVSLQGGLYMELGIYVELKAFAKSDWFKVKASASLYEDKFPLLEIGYQYVLLRFLDESSSVIINEDQFPLYGNAGLLDAEYIDMKTGKIVQSSEIDMSKIISNFAISFSSPYFEYSDDDYTFRVLKENFGVHYDSLPYVSPQATRLDITIYVYYTGGNLAFSNRNGQDTMKQIELIWIDPGIDISGNPDLNAVKATYVADIDGTEYPIAEKWLPFGDIPGSIDYSPYVTGSKFIGYTNDPTQPIYEDTTYTLHLKRYQQLVSYITYHGDSWHFDVYAANVGEVPVQPEDYDSSGNNLVFKGWIGIPGSSYANLGVTNTVSEIISDSTYMDIDSNNIISIWSPSGDYVYSDLDTTKPLFSASGSYDDCIGYYYSGFFREAPFYKCSQYLYEAQYDGGPFTITLNYPALSYSYMGITETYEAETFVQEIDYNQAFSVSTVNGYPGCNLPVWDEDGDGEPDFPTFFSILHVMDDITLSAIVKHRTYEITVMDSEGNTRDTVTVNEGDLPPIITEEPDFNDSEDYGFMYWMISKDGGGFEEWNPYYDPGVFADWIIKPVYNKIYTITIDYGGGSHEGSFSETIKLSPGTYNVSEIIDYIPERASDVYNDYIFTGWDCGNSFTVTDALTIKAEYDVSPITYTIDFNTSHGTLAGGGSHETIVGDFNQTTESINAFMLENETLGTVYTEDKVYEFEGWDMISLADHHIRYEAIWNWTYRTYSLTFDSGSGIFNEGEEVVTIQVPYGTSLNLSTISSRIITPEIQGYSYSLTGWSSDSSVLYATDDRLVISGNSTLIAEFEKGSPILYTVTINASGGKFNDGTSTKIYSGFYGDSTGIDSEIPVRPIDPYYNYTFDGWSAPLPDTFESNMTITALWLQTVREYTISFDANGGTYPAGGSFVSDKYHYGDTVVIPDQPVKADDTTYTYEFVGWNPDISNVISDLTYTAQYIAKLIGAESTGIYVSDGISTEDVNCNGKDVSGYTYEVQSVTIDGILKDVPLLTITGNGLTLSGSNNFMYIMIGTGCTNINFNDLSLNGEYPIYTDGEGLYHTGQLVIAAAPTDTVTINIAGNCELINSYIGAGAVWSASGLNLIGQGASPSLSITSIGMDALYSPGLNVNGLTLDITASPGPTPGMSNYAMTGEGFDDSDEWLFVNSTVTARGTGVIGVFGNVVIQGNTNLTLISTDSGKAAIQAIGWDTLGYLKFIDFTGRFSAGYSDSDASGPAIQATTGITFTPDVSNYELGGAQVSLSTDSFDGLDSYYTFQIGSGGGTIPDSSILIVPK